MTQPYNPLALTQPVGSTTVEPLRLLLYGKPKTRKTWFAGTASETHRVTLLDGENNTGILRMLPADAQATIARIPLAGSPTAPAFADFCAACFKLRRFIWSMAEQRIVEARHINESHDAMWFIKVDVNLLTTDDVLVIDSWTKLVSDMGLRYADQNALDIFMGERGKKTAGGKNDAMDYFRFMDMALDALLQAFQSMPCHIILIGHQQEYEVETKTPLGTKRLNKIQVISGSGKHSAKVPAFVSDVLYFESNDDGKTTTVHCASETLRDGGGANVPPESYQFPKWNFASLLASTNKPVASSRAALSIEKQAFAPLTGAQLRAILGAPKAGTVASAQATGIIGLRK